jgi:hypothetical protein
MFFFLPLERATPAAFFFSLLFSRTQNPCFFLNDDTYHTNECNPFSVFAPCVCVSAREADSIDLGSFWFLGVRATKKNKQFPFSTPPLPIFLPLFVSLFSPGVLQIFRTVYT